jgi:Ser/Thr protein kinase RdoA (MazF antagonist)
MAAGREPAVRKLGFPVAAHELLTARRNARTWWVSGPAGVAVAKLVEPGDASLGQFVGSLRIAAALDSGDLPTAPPLQSRDGRLAVPAGPGLLALLPWLDGRPLKGTADADLERMGAVLATLHSRAVGIMVPGGIPPWPWSWLSLDALGLKPLDPGDAGLVVRAASAAAGTHSLGVVHGDPTPDHFLAIGPVTAVIDWATVMQGPLRYDLAVLALTAERAGARPDQVRRLIAGYDAAARETGQNPRRTACCDTAANEAADAAALARMRTLRLASEIVYFTSRLRQPIAASTATFDEDLAGLARARTGLRELE